MNILSRDILRIMRIHLSDDRRCYRNTSSRSRTRTSSLCTRRRGRTGCGSTTAAAWAWTTRTTRGASTAGSETTTTESSSSSTQHQADLNIVQRTPSAIKIFIYEALSLSLSPNKTKNAARNEDKKMNCIYSSMIRSS